MKKLTISNPAVSVQLIERRIYLIRGHKVMIDVDLAELYGVPTHRLNERVKRNRKRFPEDFMFQLSKEESEKLEIAICDLKIWSWWAALTAVRLHRARGRNVVECPE